VYLLRLLELTLRQRCHARNSVVTQKTRLQKKNPHQNDDTTPLGMVAAADPLSLSLSHTHTHTRTLFQYKRSVAGDGFNNTVEDTAFRTIRSIPYKKNPQNQIDVLRHSGSNNWCSCVY
jgi:hypothetical protein